MTSSTNNALHDADEFIFICFLLGIVLITVFVVLCYVYGQRYARRNRGRRAVPVHRQPEERRMEGQALLDVFDDAHISSASSNTYNPDARRYMVPLNRGAMYPANVNIVEQRTAFSAPSTYSLDSTQNMSAASSFGSYTGIQGSQDSQWPVFKMPVSPVPYQVVLPPLPEPRKKSQFQMYKNMTNQKSSLAVQSTQQKSSLAVESTQQKSSLAVHSTQPPSSFNVASPVISTRPLQQQSSLNMASLGPIYSLPSLPSRGESFHAQPKIPEESSEAPSICAYSIPSEDVSEASTITSSSCYQ
ncbi:hypothetical protein L596_022584 [Steinernema carpocapsae]|uniref:Uncharacterized protein n=1 Tax=Steinernema carpocapsae TaxID=34508 RepID=A0A4U5MM32_STECR|nr:hypothetical protein L596_022584 [Steinernema carpocapsae]